MPVYAQYLPNPRTVGPLEVFGNLANAERELRTRAATGRGRRILFDDLNGLSPSSWRTAELQRPAAWAHTHNPRMWLWWRPKGAEAPHGSRTPGQVWTVDDLLIVTRETLHPEEWRTGRPVSTDTFVRARHRRNKV